jgi:hypothetical protein
MRLNEQTLAQLCEAFAVTPKWTGACRAVGIERTTLHKWMARSRKGEQQLVFYWDGDGVTAPLHIHLEAARQINILALEASVRSMALEGWSTPKYFQGAPVWEVDPVLAADAKDAAVWEVLYGDRDRNDIYKRDPISGGLVQAMDTVKPSPEIQVKILEQLKTYRKTQQLDVHVSGGLLRLDRPDEQKTVAQQEQQQPFVGDESTEQQEKANNFLALGRPANSSAEFEQWNKDGEFNARPVTFKRSDGTVQTRIATLEDQPGDSEVVRRMKAQARIPPANPMPRTLDELPKVGKPDKPTPGPNDDQRDDFQRVPQPVVHEPGRPKLDPVKDYYRMVSGTSSRYATRMFVDVSSSRRVFVRTTDDHLHEQIEAGMEVQVGGVSRGSGMSNYNRGLS